MILSGFDLKPEDDWELSCSLAVSFPPAESFLLKEIDLRANSVGTLDSATNVLRLLKLLGTRGSLTVAEACHELGVGKSTAHRLFMTLLSQGYAIRDSSGRQYYAGQAAVAAGLSSVWDFDLPQRLSHPLEHLAKSIGETVMLQVLDGPYARVLEVGVAPNSLRLGTALGELLPANATSGGKVLLSHHTEETLRERFGRRLPKLTEKTIVDWDFLIVELQVVRKRGWATSEGESSSRVNGLAVPVIGHNERIVGAIAVAAPEERMSRSVQMGILGPLTEVSKRISWLMKHQ